MSDAIASIGILAWGPGSQRAKNTVGLLQTLIAQDVHLWAELIVLVNGPHPELPSNDRFPHVRFLSSQLNLGVASGWNLLVSAASCDSVILLNEDAEVPTAELLWLAENLEAGFDLVGLRQSWWSLNTVQPSCGEAKNSIECVFGFAFATKKEMWKRVGGFNENLTPAFYEEIDYAFAVNSLGGRVRNLPNTDSTHLAGISSGRDPSRLISWNGFTTTAKDLQMRNYAHMIQVWSPSRAVRVLSRTPASANSLLGISQRIICRIHRHRLKVANRTVERPSESKRECE